MCDRPEMVLKQETRKNLPRTVSAMHVSFLLGKIHRIVTEGCRYYRCSSLKGSNTCSVYCVTNFLLAQISVTFMGIADENQTTTNISASMVTCNYYILYTVSLVPRPFCVSALVAKEYERPSNQSDGAKRSHWPWVSHKDHT